MCQYVFEMVLIKSNIWSIKTTMLFTQAMVPFGQILAQAWDTPLDIKIR